MIWEIDPTHSTVEFTVKHMMVTTVKGRFKDVSGRIEVDDNNPLASSVTATIQTASIDTGQEQRDAHLRSADFFDAAQYPTLTFTSKAIEQLGDDHYKVIGDLTMHGVTREVPLDVTFEGEIRDLQGKRRASYSMTAAINRKDFGLNWNVALESGGWLVSETVKIAIEVEVIEAVPATVA
ncbi:MAG TPA: YceI family protein [Ktedonobacterales bacterium]